MTTKIPYRMLDEHAQMALTPFRNKLISAGVRQRCQYDRREPVHTGSLARRGLGAERELAGDRHAHRISRQLAIGYQEAYMSKTSRLARLLSGLDEGGRQQVALSVVTAY